MDCCIDLAKDAWAVPSVPQHFSSPMGARMPANIAAANVLTLLQIKVSASAKRVLISSCIVGTVTVIDLYSSSVRTKV